MPASPLTPHGSHRGRRLRRRRLVLVGVLVLALVSFGDLGAFSGDARRSPALSLVRSWVTTADGHQLLAEQAPMSFREGAGAGSPAVTVDPTQRYQTIDGFGASITDSSAAVLYRLDARTRDATMVELFDPRRGAGLSYLRQPMGASDFVDEKPYTYDDMAPGASDYAMEHFSIEH